MQSVDGIAPAIYPNQSVDRALVTHNPSNAQWQRLLAVAQTQSALALSAAGARVQADEGIAVALAIQRPA